MVVNELQTVKRELSLPKGEMFCRECGGWHTMVKKGDVVKTISFHDYRFVGYECMSCGHLEIVQVLDDVE